jgi:hypothetical protein
MLQAVPNLVLGILIMSSYYIFFEGIWARLLGERCVVLFRSRHSLALVSGAGMTACQRQRLLL